MTIASQSDLFGQERPALPPPRKWYRIQVLRIEPIDSKRGAMWRLVARINRGPWAGVLVYKPLTHDGRGLQWLDDQAHALRLRLPIHVPYRPDAYAQAVTDLLSAETALESLIYHYEHPDQVFPTMSRLRRST